MSNATPQRRPVERPISPHLQVYRLQIHMLMSGLHRVTGAALYVGTALLAWWLIAVASGPRYFEYVNGILGHPIGKLILFGYTWALVHHMVGGVRHLIWDTGRGFDLGTVKTMSWLTIISSVVLTLLLWGVGLFLRGAF
ncbi:MAG TPA: succinate dehydrogenase, cytochrome b556 subunit [Hyphomicrobiaceae bacterium]|nr:succinate dehydrogenase, cytochrome b556 subunit [Hyphomicrobiaceae bacterium]